MESEEDKIPGPLSRWGRKLRRSRALFQILKIALFIAFWVLAVSTVLVMVAFVAVIFVPMDSVGVTFTNDDGGTQVPLSRVWILCALAGAAGYVGGFALIMANLRRILVTLSVGDPFHPDNSERLKRVGLILATVTGAAWVGQTLVARLARGSMDPPSLFDLATPFFSVLIVFVLAEVFREGARLRRESELTI